MNRFISVGSRTSRIVKLVFTNSLQCNKQIQRGLVSSHIQNKCKLSRSFDHGISDTPLLGKTIGEVIDETTEQYSDNEAIVDQLAASLLALGLKKGDVVGVWGQNHLEWVLAFYAIVRAGLIVMNVNPAYKAEELEYAINKIGMKCIFVMPHFKDSDYYEILKQVAPEIENCVPGALKSEKLPSLQHVVMTEGPSKLGTFSFEELSKLGGFEEHQKINNLKKEIQFDDPVNIQFTSGTTGKPKGATLTHHNLLNNGYFFGKSLGYDKSTKICISVPLYHCFGLVLGSINSLLQGSTQVYPARGFDAESCLKAVSNERCTSIYGTPAMFIDMLNHPNFEQYDYTSLETGVMAGSPCPIEVMNKIIDKMNCKEMTIAYGLTETSPVATLALRDSPVELRTSTVGQILPHMEVKIVDAEGRVVPVNTKGEVCFRGHCVMQGYWNDEDKTKEVIDSNRWFYSGDLGVLSEDGYLQIVGRLKDMVIRGGENIYPTEVENFLHKHPKIEDIQVFGVPDERMGEELCAWIKLKRDMVATSEEIKAFCKGKISHYKIPRYIQFVDNYPMTVTGKIQKHLIREEMMKILQQRNS